MAEKEPETEMEFPHTRENYVRANRATYFKDFDAVAMRYLTKGEEIPDEWKAYGQALRDMTEDCDDSKVSLVGNSWQIHWPQVPGKVKSP